MLTDLNWEQGEFTVSTVRSRLDLETIQRFLTNSYWAAGISRTLVEKAIEHSLSFGVYHADLQVGFARVISDYTTFAYVADVFIVEEYRGQGLSKWLMRCVVEHPALQGLRRWTLFTKDAHRLYAQVGFTALKTPERAMEQTFPDIYLQAEQSEGKR